MKFGQVIEYKKRFFFYFKYHSENETGRLVPDLLFFKNALYDVKNIVLNLAYCKNKLYETLEYWSQDMLSLIF